jgi:hypothetical protein
LGESKISERSKLNWGISLTLLMEACRTEFKMFLEKATGYQLSVSQLQTITDIFKN